MSAHFESSLEQKMSVEADKPIILVVDDSRVMRVALKKMLRAGFEVIEACDGEDGWSKLEQNPAITAVFSDLSMPVLDGFGFLDRVRSSQSEWIQSIPFIVITGNEDDDGVREKALECGANDFITKPFRSSEIMDRANRYVSQAQQQATEITQPAGGTPPMEMHRGGEEATAGVVSLEQEQKAVEKQAEDSARKFAEQEAAKMRESLLEHKKMEDEISARRRSEEIARHDAVARKQAEENLAKREAMFEERSHSLDRSGGLEVAADQGESIQAADDNGTIEFNTGDALLADQQEPQGIELVSNSRFESWHQNSDPVAGMTFDSERIKQDKSLQAELDEALSQALSETSPQSGMTLELEEIDSDEMPGQPESELDEMESWGRQTAQEPVSEAPVQDPLAVPPPVLRHGIQAQPVRSGSVDYGNEPHLSSKDERVAETARIREALSKMRNDEEFDGESGHSFIGNLFAHMSLPFIKLLNKISGSRFKHTIMRIEERLGR